MQNIRIFDTTLRDGEQSPGCSMNLREKIEVALQLERLNVDVIEAGFAIASQGDFHAISEIAKVVQNTTIASLSRARIDDIDAAYQAIKHAKRPRIHTFIATSDIHMRYKLKLTPDAVFEQATSMVKYAKRLVEDIEFSAEDASRSNPEFLYRLLESVISAGATVVNIPDTVGYATPDEFYTLIKGIRDNVSNIHKAEISVHCHNDLGLAVANSIAAAKAGATQIECTINGIGERAGNAALEEIVMILNTRSDIYNLSTGIDTKQIYHTSRLVSKVTGARVQNNKAIVGSNAFAHESGIHQHGMMAHQSTYEIMTPESIGLSKNNLVLGKHSGRHALTERVKQMGYTLSTDKLEAIFTAFKDLADKKKVIDDRDIEALIQDKDFETKDLYTLKEFVINSGNTITATANIKLHKNNESHEAVCHGHGPVDAAFKAIDRIMGIHYTLEDYTLQSVTEGMDALGEALVKIKVDDQIFSGHGLSTDVIEASIKAYVNAINKSNQHERGQMQWA